jgi:hypothetical protein
MTRDSVRRVWDRGDRLTGRFIDPQDPRDLPDPICPTCGGVMDWAWGSDPTCPDCDSKETP